MGDGGSVSPITPGSRSRSNGGRETNRYGSNVGAKLIAEIGLRRKESGARNAEEEGAQGKVEANYFIRTVPG